MYHRWVPQVIDAIMEKHMRSSFAKAAALNNKKLK
jgi:hypothetical protein